VTKSAAVFDVDKLTWMNGQILRSLPDDEVSSLVREHLAATGRVAADGGAAAAAWSADVAGVAKKSLSLVADAGAEVDALLAYPLQETLASGEVNDVVADGLGDVAAAVLAAWDDGSLAAACASDGGADVKAWFKAVGKAQERKGKRLFMPLRVCLTGRAHGPDVPAMMNLVRRAEADGVLGEAGSAALVPLAARMEALRAAAAKGFGA